MHWNFDKFFKVFEENNSFYLLLGIKQGFERESFRITPEGMISGGDHPKTFGSPLSNPYITTDFAQAQLELVTPPLLSVEEAVCFLRALHTYVNEKIEGELLWPLSMPPHIETGQEVRIARYGNSKEGRKKELYREGLIARYGKNMQLISGVHFNFSYTEPLWDFLKERLVKPPFPKQLVSECYLHIIRNFFRYGWLLTYLFGASPALDKSYLSTDELEKLDPQTLYGPYATSLRMSHLGYYHRIDQQVAINYNSLPQFLRSMKEALTTKDPQYRDPKKNYGLNRNILQIENEHYTRVRPKQLTLERESLLEALGKRGISHLEIRSLDCNPEFAIGFDHKQIYFLQLFLFYCLAKESPPLFKEEQAEICRNQDRAALQGRDPGLMLENAGKKVSLKEWAGLILKEMKRAAKAIEAELKIPFFSKLVSEMQSRVEHQEETPSAKQIEALKKDRLSFQEYGLAWAKRHKSSMDSCAGDQEWRAKFDAAAKCDPHLLDGYEDLELSTQILIKEAFKRKIHVEVIDREANFISLKKGKKIEYVQQATKTSKDPFVSTLILENKSLTKVLLQREGFSTPIGRKYSSFEDAIVDYPLYANQKIVIKPLRTNFGIGVFFIEPGDHRNFERSLKAALAHDSILVETFHKGGEYRFLVIGGKVIGIAHRDPANITGDGSSTIKELIDAKNAAYKLPKESIRLDETELNFLIRQNLTPDSIPRKGVKIYLRENSNVSTGGDSIDATEQISPLYKKIALKAVKALNVHICGVDMIIGNPKLPPKNNYWIIEMNINPMLPLHEFPFKGKRRNTAGPLLRLLGF